MTSENQEKLKQVTKNVIYDNKGGASLYMNEKAPRQLLVNESVLRRNQQYRQTSAAI